MIDHELHERAMRKAELRGFTGAEAAAFVRAYVHAVEEAQARTRADLRARFEAILALPEAAGRELIAIDFALATDDPVHEVAVMLRSFPAQEAQT